MAIARFHSFRGQKSALILVKANKFQFNWDCAYVPKESVEGKVQGDEFPIPDGYKLVPIVDIDSGVVRTSNDGSVLHTLSW